MSDQFEHDEAGKVSFGDLLNAAMPAIRSKFFANVGYDELSVYAIYIQYRVQRDFFDLVEESEPGTITWKDFRLLLRGRKELRDKCIDVIGRKLETAFFQYDFNVKKPDLSQYADIADVSMIQAVRLFSDGDGILLAGLFLYFAEQSHLNHLRETVRPDYKWDEYYYDLHHDRELWMEVLTAFRNAILALDFKRVWQEVDFGL